MDKDDTVKRRNIISLFVASAIVLLYLGFILFADIANQLFSSSSDKKLSLEIGMYFKYDGYFFLALILVVAFCLFVRFSVKRVGEIKEAETGNDGKALATLTRVLYAAVIIEETILLVFLTRGIGECFDSVISPCADPFDMQTFFKVILPLGKTTVFSFLLIFPMFNRIVVLFLFFLLLVYTGFLQLSPQSSYSKSKRLVLMNFLLLILISVILVATDWRSIHPIIGPMMP